MSIRTWMSSLLLAVSLTAGHAASSQAEGATQGWTAQGLGAALAAAGRSQEDRALDADRKPAELIAFFGVRRGMTVVDVMAGGGYLTEALAVAVGSEGKVYAQNTPFMLRMLRGYFDNAITARLANNRLPNVTRADGDLPVESIPEGGVDMAVTAMNFHDMHNRTAAIGHEFLKQLYSMLKPGGVLGVTDHAGQAAQNNARLHRVPKQDFIDAAKAVGFVVEAESDLLAHPADDYTKSVFDPAVRGRTDQFVMRLRKPG
jgi:predicted methyltransferase